MHDEERARFNEWKRKVDAAVAARCGLSADDLPDVDYWSMFADGESPEVVADVALAGACEDVGLDFDEVFG